MPAAWCASATSALPRAPTAGSFRPARHLCVQVCNQAPESVYGTIIQNKINSDLDAAQAVGRIVYTAQAIVENAAEKVGDAARSKHQRALAAGGCCREPPLRLRPAFRRAPLAPAPLPDMRPSPPPPPPLQYPFGGLPNFPEAYPILLSGLSQTNASTGESVTGALGAGAVRRTAAACVAGGRVEVMSAAQVLACTFRQQFAPAPPPTACSAGPERRGVQLTARGAAHL